MEDWGKDEWSLLLSAMGAVFGALTLIVSILIYKASRSRKLSISSRVELVENEVVARVKVMNLGQARAVVENVGLSLSVWDDRPRLKVKGVLRFLRYLEFLADHEEQMKYVSDSAIVGTHPEYPVSLSEYQPLTVNISLDRMMENFFSRREIIGSKLSFAFLLLTLRCEVVITTGTIGKLAHREIRLYLWQKYKDDRRLFCVDV
ncbi:hypothetical protein GCM10007160_42110 [Litchfieldella qijiaojingensis]|uniref:Uncharacterized protein n=1 Tax=Litchfieldella qijiaojingensis TaxID=980347 RepID=A0ABQ2ZAQ8_9GAMM|nr:hypothetical protein [Halomonas qijiaojingensis]GGY10484.1 hypothetical protein GCM10007160_42110 [Halomonas qijiaojingensis]